MRVSNLIVLAIATAVMAGCAHKRPTPVIIPSESQVEQGKAEPQLAPVK